MTVVAVISIGLVLLVAGGCDGGIVDDSAVTTTDTRVTDTSRDTPPDAGSSDATSDSQATTIGTRRDPIPVGQEAVVGAWEVRITDVLTDATQVILDENMFNEPPESDARYVLITLDATYVGEVASTFWIDILCTFVGDEGDTFSLASVVPPTPITDTAEVATGGAVSGNVVFAVASKEIAGGTLMLQDLVSREGGRVFFAIE